MALYTLGYEGSAIEDFLAALQRAKIELVVDVRALPLSRKPGFSKTVLAKTLEKEGIGYAHRVALGTPKPIRARYKSDGDFAVLSRDFHKYLAHQELALAELVDLVKGKRACLVCFEADPALCHRSIVAEEARKRGASKVVHLRTRG
jgi:uncharacterized protein (DUF488 family)